MERLDHFVIHIDNDLARLDALKGLIEPMGFPFNPGSGKGTKGFKVANIWVGNQYVEMPWLKTSDGGGWRKEWVDMYNQGIRGLYGLCIMTDRLDALRYEWKKRGIPAGEPERITFKMLFGLLKKSLPFRKVYTPAIPGTHLQIFFLEMDSKDKYEYTKKYFMKPNAEQNGITGIHDAFVKCRFSEEAWKYINTLFSDMTGDDAMKTYDMGTTKLHFVQTDDPELKLELHAPTASDVSKSFQVENVQIVTQPL